MFCLLVVALIAAVGIDDEDTAIVIVLQSRYIHNIMDDVMLA